MSKTVDEKVVSMKFDNSDFEANVKTTMSTLDKLKQSLNLKGVSEGLENVGKAAKNCDMSHLSNGIETVQAKFSVMQIAGITAISEITKSVMDLGKKIVNMFAIEPVTTGFSEYELKMGSVQTIMASTGASLSTVNKYLEELNLYADKTIYSFSDMTNNIGKFTNAGVKLEDAVLAIKGVSNEAAVSGANANEASRAMYNFAQALSAGYVKLIDWKSIENANMATVEFKEQLLNTALAMGTVVEQNGKYVTTTTNLQGKVSEAFTATSMFNESLAHQWMTTDVLTQTLSNYAQDVRDMSASEKKAYEEKLRSVGYTEKQIKSIEELGKKAFDSAQDVKTFSMMMDTLKEAAQSGWAQTWEIIIGDFEEAKSFWTDLTNLFGGIIDKMSTVRNNFLNKVLGESGEDSWNKLANKVEKAGVSVEDFKKKLVSVGKQQGVVTDKMIKKAGSFEKSLKSGWLTSDIVSKALNSYVKSANSHSESTEDMTKKLKYFQKVVNEVWNGDYKNGEERVKALTKAGYNYAEVQALVNKTVDGHKLTLADLSDKQLKSVGYTDKQIAALKKLKAQAEETGTPLNQLIEDMSKPSGRTLLLESFSHILGEIGKVLEAIGKAWKDAFGDVDLAGKVSNAIEAFHDWAMNIEVADETLQNITDTVTGFLNAIKLVGIFTSGTFKFLNTLFTRILNILQLDFTGFTARLGRMITAFYNWLTTNNDVVQGIVKMGNKALDYIEESVDVIRKWFSEFVKLEVVQENLKRFKQAIIDTFGNLKEWLNGFVPIFSNFVEDLRSIKNLSFEDIKNAVVNFCKNLVEHLSNVGSVFSDVIEAIKKFIDDAMSSFEGFNNGVENVWTKIYNFLKGIKDKITENFGFAEIFAVLTGGAIIFGAFKLLSIVEKLTKQLFKLSDGIAGVFGGLKSMFTSFGKAEEIRARGEAIRNIAIGVGILAASLYLLSKIEQEKLGQAVGLLIGIIVVLGVLAVALGKLGEVSIAFRVGAAAIAMVAGSMFLLAISLRMLKDVDPATAVANAAILVGAMVVLITAIGVLSHFAPQLAQGSIIFLSLGLSLMLMAKSLQMISEIDPKEAERSLDAIKALMVGLVVLLLIVNKSGEFAAKSGLAVLALSASLLIIIAAIKLISGLEPGEVLKGIIVIGLIGVLFAGIIAVTKFAGKHAAKSGLTLLGFSVSLLIMVGVVKAINTITPEEMEKAIDIIGYFAIIFSLLIAATQLAGKHSAQAGVMLITAAGAMLLLTAAVVVLSHVKPDGLERAMVAISIMGIIFTMLIGITSISNITGDTYKTLIAMVVGMGALVVAVAVLAMVPEENLLRATSAVTLVMLSLAAVIASTSKLAPIAAKSVGTLAAIMVMVGGLTALVYALSYIDSTNTVANAAALAILMTSLSVAIIAISKVSDISKGAMLAVLELSGIVAILAIILGTMSALNVTASIQSATALSILLLTMSACMVILSYTSPLADGAILAMYGLAGVVAILAVVLGVMSAFDVNPSLETAASLSILLLSLSACCVILGMAGAAAPAALSGIGVLAVLITGIGALMLAIGALAEHYPKMEEFLNKGLSMLQLIGEGIGSFFGGIASGFLDAATNDLETVAENLSNFMEKLKPFLDGVSAISEESVAGFDRLSQAIGGITSAGFVDAFTQFMTGSSSLETFGEQLVPFGESLKAYSDAVQGVDSEAVKSSAEAAKGLSELANSLPSQGGWAQTILGSKDLSAFGTQLVAFGGHLKAYGDSIGDLPVENIKKSATAGQALSDLANSLPSADGWAQTIFGGKDLGNFGSTLKDFGDGLSKYGTSVSELPVEAITNSVSAGKALADLANALPDTETWAETIFGGGQETLSGFGDNIKTFGESLQSFSEYEIDADKITAVTNASKRLADLKAPEDTTTLNTLGSCIKSFGTNMASFSEKISDVDNGKMSSIISQSNRLVSFVNSLGDLNTSGIASFKKAINDLSTVNVSGMVKSLGSAKISGVNAIKSMMSGMNSAVVSGGSKLASSFKVAITLAIARIKASSTTFMAVGKHLSNALTRGIQSGAPGVMSATRSVVSSCKSVADTAKTDFYNIGLGVAQGFANGINDNTYLATAKAKAMAKAAEDAAKEELDINSPSKKFRKIGSSVPEGFAQGVGMLGGMVDKSVKSMADGALDGTRKAISRLSDMVNSDIDAQPTIRPVLDLSDVQSGANAIGDLLGYSPSMALATNVGSMMNRRIQNGANSEVVSAIDKLNKSLNNLERPSYNINGITYDDGSNISSAVETLVRAARMERRV